MALLIVTEAKKCSLTMCLGKIETDFGLCYYLFKGMIALKILYGKNGTLYL